MKNSRDKKSIPSKCRTKSDENQMLKQINDKNISLLGYLDRHQQAYQIAHGIKGIEHICIAQTSDTIQQHQEIFK